MISAEETKLEERIVPGGLLIQREYSDGSLSTEFVPDPPFAGEVLGARIDATLDDLRDRIGTFDTDNALTRWATVKLALRIVLALARIVRGRTETDG